MKKIIKLLFTFIIMLALASCSIIKSSNLTIDNTSAITSSTNNNFDVINNGIKEANNYLTKYELDNSLFSNILEMKLKNSLVYNIEENEYFIIYNDLYYKLNDNILEQVNDSQYIIVDCINDAFNLDNGSRVITRGYYEVNDGGNGFYLVNSSNNDNYIISNNDKTLSFINYDSTINVLQMGYKNTDSLETYINEFNNLKYNNIFIPEGEYRILDNFDINVSNKGYYGYNALICSDDSYNPIGFNNGCLFNIYNNISNITINGFNVKPIINNKLDNPLLGLLTLKDCSDIVINNCSFYLDKKASMYNSSGMIDLFTNWNNVTIKNCHLENHSSTAAGGGIGVRDIYKKGCNNAVIENNYIYSNCKDEVIAIFSGGDTSLYPNESGGGYIRDVYFRNNTIIGGKPNDDLGPRVVGLTIGYQISPVYNINFIDNDIEIYSANYLLLYGKADLVTFRGNNVKIDSSYQDDLYVVFCHNSKADEAFNIKVEDNSFSAINNSSIYTLAQANIEFEFINNSVKGDRIVRVFDSISNFKNNNIEFTTIAKCVYHNIRKTDNNTIRVSYINVIYEFYNLNLSSNILIDSDNIIVNEMGANMLMFNGNISFNGYSVTFKDFDLKVNNISSAYYYLAYDTSSIKDSLVIDFINCILSLYADSRHNYIAKDTDNKVIVNFINE